MFRIHEIVNEKRSPGKKRFPPSDEELYVIQPHERDMPYLSIVPAQVFSNEKYCRLETHEQGLYLKLVVHVLWPDKVRTIRHAGDIARRLGVTAKDWMRLEEVLLKNDLLIVSPDGNYLIQPELRGQYLMTLETCNQHSKRLRR